MTTNHYLWDIIKAAFLDGAIRDVKSFYEVQMLYRCKVDAVVLITRLASGRKAGTKQTGRGKKSVCRRDQNVHVSLEYVLS